MRKRVLSVLVCGFLWAGLVFAAADSAALQAAAAKLPATFQNRPLVFIPLVTAAPKELKGDLSDPAWAKGAKLDFVVNFSGNPAQFKSEARVFCTADALYVGVKFADPDPDNLATAAPEIWERDSFEVFLFPGEDPRGKLYYQTIIDANNREVTTYSHLYPRRKLAGLKGEWKPRLRHAVKANHDGWTGELRIPFSELKLPPEVLEKKSLWRLDLFRTRPWRNNAPMECSSWSPTLNEYNHTAPRFGYALLAPFATAELLDSVTARAAAQQAAPTAPPSAAQAKEIAAQIEALGSEAYQLRHGAAVRLEEMMADRNAAAYLEQVLAKTSKDSPDTETRLRAHRLMLRARQMLSPDEDVPPPNLR